MAQLAYVSNIQKFCTHDGPGIRTNVFLKGCALRCRWCSNPENMQVYPQLMFYKNKCTGCGRCISRCAHEAITFENGSIVQNNDKCRNCGACTKACMNGARELNGELKSTDEVFEIVEKDRIFYEQSGGGVTFSGGEPFLQVDFVRDVAKKCKESGYNTAVETCGKFCLEPVLEIISLIDYVFFDIKIIDEKKHVEYCGMSNKKIHSNFESLLTETKVTPRIPIIPSVNDTPQDIDAFRSFFERYKSEISEIHILPYHNLGMGKYDALQEEYKLKDLKPPADEHMEKIKNELEKTGLPVIIGG